MAKAFEKFLKERRKQEMQLLVYRMEDENDKKKKAKEESENCIIENGTFLLKEKEIIIDFMQENGLDESTLGGTFQDTYWENGTFMSFPEQLPPPPERPQYREPPHPSNIDPWLAQPPPRHTLAASKVYLLSDICIVESGIQDARPPFSSQRYIGGRDSYVYSQKYGSHHGNKDHC